MPFAFNISSHPVILAPSPTPPPFVPLAASLLKAGYVVLVAVPQVKEEALGAPPLWPVREDGTARPDL